VAKTKGDLVKGVKITITSRRVGKEAPVEVFKVVIVSRRKKTKGSWCAGFGSREQLEAFLAGLRCSAMMIAGEHAVDPELPHPIL